MMVPGPLHVSSLIIGEILRVRPHPVELGVKIFCCLAVLQDDQHLVVFVLRRFCVVERPGGHFRGIDDRYLQMHESGMGVVFYRDTGAFQLVQYALLIAVRGTFPIRNHPDSHAAPLVGNNSRRDVGVRKAIDCHIQLGLGGTEGFHELRLGSLVPSGKVIRNGARGSGRRAYSGSFRLEYRFYGGQRRGFLLDDGLDLGTRPRRDRLRFHKHGICTDPADYGADQKDGNGSAK